MSKKELYIDKKASNDSTFGHLDVNDLSSATNWVEVESCKEVMVYVESKSGTNTTFKTCVEISPDGTFNGGCFRENGSDVTLQGEGYMHIHNTKAIEYLRVRCIAVEGAGAAVNVCLQGFRKSN